MLQFKNKNLDEYDLSELHTIDWELAAQEYRFTEAMKHPKFGNKIKPIPTMNKSFIELRQAVQNKIKEKENVIS